MSAPIYVYGLHAVLELLRQRPEDALELFVQSGRDDERLSEISDLAKESGVSVQPASRARLSELCEATAHQGAVVRARPLNLKNESDLFELIESGKDLLILDSITDPHNLGACIRTAAAMGLGGVIFAKDKSADLTPAAIKVAAGACELIDLVRVTNLVRAIETLQSEGVLVVGTSLSPEASRLQDFDFSGQSALVMGSEGAGLRRLTAERCDGLGYIPLTGSVQSLNVSVATGMGLYELMRQKSAG